MKRFIFDLALALSITGLIGCASASSRSERIDSVLSSQINVLKKIKNLREQDAVKTKINADPLLAEQESVLMSGISSVIDSQEAFLKIRKQTFNNRGLNVY